MTLRVALVGYGYWGPNLARNIAETPGLELAAIVENDRERVELARHRHPLAVTQTLSRLAAHDSIDAVAIATPPGSHYGLASLALEHGWHVLVAKPLAARLEHAQELAGLADDRGLVLMTDHTFVHTGAVRRLAELAPTLGRPLYYDSVRVNLGLYQADTSVVWDLAPHDLSIVQAVFPDERPVEVACVAEDRTGNGQPDVAWLTVWHASGFVAHTHLSWLSPVKVRRALIAGADRMAVYDDMEPSEKLRLYDAGVDLMPGPETHRALVDYRTGDCWAPHLDFTEALAVELAAFARLTRALAVDPDGLATARRKVARDGVDVVRVLEAADRSLTAGGCRVPLDA